MLRQGQTVESDSRIVYTVDELISYGTAQGDVYRVLDDMGTTYALKMFHAGEEERMLKQIRILMNRGHACPAYVHPLDVVRMDGGIGYVMEYIPDTYLSGSVLVNGVEHDGCREELPFHVKMSVLHNLAEALAILYNANLAMMDLKFDNIKICPEDASVKILDTDTVVDSDDGEGLIEGTVGFMPPLTMRHEEAPGKYNDSYALAVMIFMALMGTHPLVGTAGDVPHNCDTETYLFSEHPVFVMHPADTSNRPCEEDYRTEEKYGKYPAAFREAMERTFVAGLYDKEKRTTPTEWCEVLKRVYEESYCCVECGEEQFFLTTDTVACDCCGCMLVKPLLLSADYHVPLYFGRRILTRELWESTGDVLPAFRVVATRYGGKWGLLSETGEITLTFEGGERIEFPRGRPVPLFMNGTYQFKNKPFVIKEA